jgi:ankyrin repeat protein
MDTEEIASMRDETMSMPDARAVFADSELIALLSAAEAGKLKAGVQPPLHIDLERQSESGLTPLMWAVGRGSVAAVRWLVSCGADVSTKSTKGNGWTALHQAAALNRSSEIIKALLSSGANPDVLDGRGFATPLITSVMQRQEESIHTLLELGADPNRRDEMGDSSLHVAAAVGDQKAVLALLEAGADPTLLNKIGATFQSLFFVTPERALSAKAKLDRRKVIEWLTAHGHPLERG